METFEAISKRKSIRNYNTKKIDDKLIEKLLMAGMNAPSAYNKQPWEFLVITEKQILSKIADFDSYASMADDAQIGILICGNLSIEDNESFILQNCAAVAENILIAATDLQLGAVWTTIYPFEEIINGFKVMFKLPDNIIPIIFIPIGYTDQKATSSNNYVKSKVHINKW